MHYFLKATLTALTLVTLTPSYSVACEYEKALHHFHSGNATDASDALSSCIESGEQVAESTFFRGIIERKQKNLKLALRFLKQAVRLDPTNTRFQLELAVTSEWLGRFDDAEQIYKSILTSEPDNLAAGIGFARMTHWRGNPSDAINLYEDLLRKFPGNRAALSGLAFALLANSELDRSRRILTEILVDSPDDSAAREGLEMIKEIRPRRLSVNFGWVRDRDGKGSPKFHLTYSDQVSYALRWGADAFRGKTIAKAQVNGGVAVNRTVVSSIGLHANYRFNAKSSALGALRRENLVYGDRQTKLHLELNHEPTPRHLFLLGIIPAYIGSNRVSTLSYAGYQYKAADDWIAGAQVFSGWDRTFNNSKAISMSWSKTYGKRSRFRVGASVTDSGGTHSNSAFISVAHYLNRDVALSVNLSNNFSTHEREITLGVIYEY